MRSFWCKIYDLVRWLRSNSVMIYSKVTRLSDRINVFTLAKCLHRRQWMANGSPSTIPFKNDCSNFSHCHRKRKHPFELHICHHEFTWLLCHASGGIWLRKKPSVCSRHYFVHNWTSFPWYFPLTFQSAQGNNSLEMLTSSLSLHAYTSLMHVLTI